MPGISLTLDKIAPPSQPQWRAASNQEANGGFRALLEPLTARREPQRVEAPSRHEVAHDADDDVEQSPQEAQSSTAEAQPLPERVEHDEQDEQDAADTSEFPQDATPGGEAAHGEPAQSPLSQISSDTEAPVNMPTGDRPEPREQPHRPREEAQHRGQDVKPQAQAPVHPQSQTNQSAEPAHASLHQTSESAEQQAPQPSPEPAAQTQPQLEQKDQREIQPRGDQRMDAAVARAMQIETAIRLENATGQSANLADAPGRGATIAIQGAAITGNGVGNNGEQAGTLSQSANIDDERFSSRIVRGLTTMINQRGGSMTMRLDPPELGQLRVQMTIARGIVAAQFTASTNQAHALLEKNMATLRLALESQGLTVDRLSVQSTQSTSTHHHAMNDHASDKHQQQRQDAAGDQSRGRRDDANEHESRGTTAGFAGLVSSLSEDGGNAS